MKKLTPKQEKFAQVFVTLNNASEAYRQAYNCEKSSPTTVTNKAYELTITPIVAARIKELRTALAKKHEKTRDEIVSDLVEIIDAFKLTGNFTPNTLKAIEILNKMLGYNEPEKVNHTGLTINIIKPTSKE